ncbi:MAG: VTC domain-containing protein [Kiritimatiellae bacterium]|nr:VTC domain-containing protein [Kiritimatiellia bacterium]
MPDRAHPAGRTNTVYYDTPDLRAWAEKEDGDGLKRKVRARWYGRPGELSGNVPVFLELKYRVGAARRKERAMSFAPASALEQAPLDDRFWLDLFARAAGRLGAPVGPAWAPTCMISYDRLRWDDPRGGSRVSLDRDIRAPRWNPARFPWGASVELGEIVCEWKNRTGDPPAWAGEMVRAGLLLRSFSKYGECMARLAGGRP